MAGVATAARLTPTGERPAEPVVDAEHPWLGLDSFTEATQAYFFGRSVEIREIYPRVREHPLTVLHGEKYLSPISRGHGLGTVTPCLLRVFTGPRRLRRDVDGDGGWGRCANLDSSSGSAGTVRWARPAGNHPAKPLVQPLHDCPNWRTVPE